MRRTNIYLSDEQRAALAARRGRGHLGGLELATLNITHFPMFEGMEPPFSLSGRG